MYCAAEVTHVVHVSRSYVLIGHFIGAFGGMAHEILESQWTTTTTPVFDSLLFSLNVIILFENSDTER